MCQSMQIKKEMTGQQAYQKLSALCARSEHCQHDLLEKMLQWGVSQEEQAAVMERLVGERYVDDERYARAFVQDKVRYNRWGRRKVEQALWLKHIDKGIIQMVLDEVGSSDYLDVLRPLLKQKRRELAAKAVGGWGRAQQAKLIQFALSRGFTMDVIKQCVDVDDEDEYMD